MNEGKAVDGDDAAVDQVVPVADDVLGYVAAERARAGLRRQSALLRRSGLNWMFFLFFAVQSPAGEETGTMSTGLDGGCWPLPSVSVARAH